MSDIKPVYAGEALLLRWSESHNGRTVTLQLDEHVGSVHPFKSLKGGPNGARMQLVAVLIDDNEEPVPPPQVGTNGADNHPAVKSNQANASIPEVAPEGLREKTPFRSLKRAAQAALKIKDDAEFRAWLQSRLPAGDAVASIAETPEGMADRMLKEHLGITSKTELDSDPAAGERWDRLLTSYTYKDRVS